MGLKISQLTETTTIAGTDEFEINNAGTSKRIKKQNITFTPAADSIGQAEIDTTSLNPVVQVVRTDDNAYATGTTTIPLDDTIPQNTEGTEFITVSITPTSATNLLKVRAQLMISASVAVTIIAAIFQDATANALSAIAGYAGGGNEVLNLTIDYEMVAGTTSATTFKIRAGGSNASSVYLNSNTTTRRFGGVANSFIEVTEVMQ